jgi:hypothetical protein
VPVRKEEVTRATREMAAILTVLLIPVVLSIPPMTLVHATTMGGTWLGYKTGSTTFPNGTKLEKETIVFVGILVGNGTYSERIKGENFDGVMVFVGSFNGSEPGSLTLPYQGSGHSFAGTMSGGTGGLVGLQLMLTATWEDCSSSACDYTGSYTVTTAPTTATTSSSTLIIAAIGAVVLRGRGKKTKT